MFICSPYNLAKFTDTYKYCPRCGLKYEREPGFFYGSMYISYAFTVAIVLTFGLGANILGNDPPLWVYLTAITVALLIFSPLSFRYARVLMLHLFGGVAYDPEALDERPVESKNAKVGD
ncbi:MAG: DUF983 domain-containing protein [Microscillaceae bacterium]|nr:DUF983 domain-containing protein [Microscillaceae bacterium]